MLENHAATIPVQFGHDLVPYILGGMDNVGGQRFGQMKNVLHLGIQTHLYTRRRMPSRFITRHPVLQLPTNISMELSWHGITSHDQVVEEKQLLAIGPGSDMSRTFGSISFVHNNNWTGSIILGSSESDFVSQHCFADSIIRLQTNEYRGYPSYSHSIGRLPSWNEEPVVFRFSTIEQILVIPRHIFTALFHQFPELLNGETILGQCIANRNRLPEIRLAFQPNDDGPGHMIMLRPEDYTRFKLLDDSHNTPTDECDFLIGISPYRGSDSQAQVDINPLLIPGLNAFTLHNSLTLCKSVQYRD